MDEREERMHAVHRHQVDREDARPDVAVALASNLRHEGNTGAQHKTEDAEDCSELNITAWFQWKTTQP